MSHESKGGSRRASDPSSSRAQNHAANSVFTLARSRKAFEVSGFCE